MIADPAERLLAVIRLHAEGWSVSSIAEYLSTSRLVETGYRSSQLTLWTLGPDEWLTFKKLPGYAARKKLRIGKVIQMPLPELDMPAQAL